MDLTNFARTPPHNTEAERAVLGAMLINPAAVDTAIEILGGQTSNIFYADAHQHIYNAMFQLARRNQPIDAATLLEQLINDGLLESVGGASYLGDLTDAVPTSANIAYYAEIVRDKAMKRELIAECSKLIAAAYEDDESQVLMDKTEASLLNLHQCQHTTGAKHIADILPEVLDDIQQLSQCEGKPPGISTGIESLDVKLGGWHGADLVIIAARTSVGKTAFGLHAAHHAAVKENVPVLFFSLEMDCRQNVQRLLCLDGGADLQRIRTGFQLQQELQKIVGAGQVLATAPIYIDDRPDMTLFEIRSRARRFAAKHGPALIVADYLQLLRSGQRSQDRQVEVAQITSGLKLLARELAVPVLALCQANRDSERQDGRPRLYHLRESGAIEQHADVVLLLSSPWKERVKFLTDTRGFEKTNLKNVLSIQVAKNRNGPKGNCDVLFQAPQQRFLPLVSPREMAAAPEPNPEDDGPDVSYEQESLF